MKKNLNTNKYGTRKVSKLNTFIDDLNFLPTARDNN